VRRRRFFGRRRYVQGFKLWGSIKVGLTPAPAEHGTRSMRAAVRVGVRGCYTSDSVTRIGCCWITVHHFPEQRLPTGTIPMSGSLLRRPVVAPTGR
jgi:hypothetical protein